LEAVAVNELLIWISARRSGSIRSFRARVAELEPDSARRGQGPAAHRLAAWTLSKLGHAEFEEAACGAGWRIAPPVLAAGDVYGSPHAVLCGARSAELLDALAAYGGADRLTVSFQPSGPDLVELRADSATVLVETARKVGIPIQWNASLAILSICPFVSGIVLQERTIPVGAGWEVSRFSKSRKAWVASKTVEVQSLRLGLFRFTGEYDTTYILNEGGRSWSCDPAVGKFRILTSRHRALVYSPGAAELAVAASCRPPELIERALVVSSGRLPDFRDGILVYTHLTRPIAEAAAALLGQSLDQRADND
jgi:hypothetical protein